MKINNSKYKTILSPESVEKGYILKNKSWEINCLTLWKNVKLDLSLTIAIKVQK